MTRVYPCDICGSEKHTPIDVARPHIGGQEPPVVCDDCGFVYVRRRRSTGAIAQDWDYIWAKGLYSSQWPAVKARLYYVREWCEQEFGWGDKTVLDVGAGEGTFLKDLMYGTWGKRDNFAGLDPYKGNVEKLDNIGITAYHGSVEAVEITEKFDVVTILWTLENCGDCIGMLKRAREFLKPDGRIVVATGSRILVPFKKPFSNYFSDNPTDLHCFRFSATSLTNALWRAGFKNVTPNRYWDTDWLVATAQPGRGALIMHDHRVIDYFNKWAGIFP